LRDYPPPPMFLITVHSEGVKTLLFRKCALHRV
jgi:hypothetical protein